MSKITWGSIFPVGKYSSRGENLSLNAVKIKYPKYLKWCYENELHLKYPEINFIFENISSKEFDDIMK